jgi:hypothetical protein
MTVPQRQEHTQGRPRRAKAEKADNGAVEAPGDVAAAESNEQPHGGPQRHPQESAPDRTAHSHPSHFTRSPHHLSLAWIANQDGGEQVACRRQKTAERHRFCKKQVKIG